MYRYLYTIRIGREHGNIMVFTSYQTAFDWCKAHTTWDNIKIINAINKVAKEDVSSSFVIPF